MQMILIRPLSPADSINISKLHIKNLNTSFTGESGIQILSLYYKVLALGDGSCGFVAEEDGQITGFVCGVWNSRLVRSLLLKKFSFVLLFWVVVQMMIRPSLLLTFVRRFTSPQSSNIEEGFELRPIVVSERARGTGLAENLVNYLKIVAKEHGFSQIFLVTEEDNLSANRFYQRSGFRFYGKEVRHSITYNRYIINTD